MSEIKVCQSLSKGANYITYFTQKWFLTQTIPSYIKQIMFGSGSVWLHFPQVLPILHKIGNQFWTLCVKAPNVRDEIMAAYAD